MGIMNGLLGASSWHDIVVKYSWAGGDGGWADTLLNVISMVFWVAMALVASAGTIYAIYVGIKMARADSAEAREENKKRMINIIVTVILVIVLILFFNLFLPMILEVLPLDDGENANLGGNTGGKTSIDAIVNTAKVFLRVA